MEPIERTVKRLVIMNRIWICLVCIVIGGMLYTRMMAPVNQQIMAFEVTRGPDEIRVSSASDGPWEITHLYNRANKASAALPQPRLIDDSGGIRISLAEMRKLEWKDRVGNRCELPLMTDDITVIYTAAKIAKDRHQSP